jgi:uracil phosphoribosyltransferase
MFVLTSQNSIANTFLSELRSEVIQQDPLRFRRNMERIGEILAYEISRNLSYCPAEVKTCLGTANTNVLNDQVVIATIMRAGLPFHQGFLNYFDRAENAFIGSYRKVHNQEGAFEIVTDYVVTPSLENKIVILADPMLATGKSLVIAYNELLKYGTPARTYFAAVIASRDGISYLRDNVSNPRLFIGDVDDVLNKKSYIVPGLGDAGDLAFGEKIC